MCDGEQRQRKDYLFPQNAVSRIAPPLPPSSRSQSVTRNKSSYGRALSDIELLETVKLRVAPFPIATMSIMVYFIFGGLIQFIKALL